MRNVGDEATAQPAVQHLEALTSLRFFAALYVLSFHYTSIPGSIFEGQVVRLGYTGVSFFFVLSGFILAHNYHQVEFAKPGVLYRYVLARLSRIYPVYVLSLLAGVPFLLMSLGKMTPGVATTMAASSLLVAPFGLQAWFPGTACSLNCPSWSISVEAFFYLMLPFLLAPIMRNPLKGFLATLSCWLAATAAYVWVWAIVSTQGSVLLSQPSPSQEIVALWIKYFPPGRLPEFCLGLVLYGLWKRQPQRFDSSSMLCTFLVVATILLTQTQNIPEIALHNGLSAVAWAPLILGAAGMKGGVLSLPICEFLGRISFSLYLLHIPIFSAVLALDNRALGQMLVAQHPTLLIVLTAALVIVCSAVVFVWVEEPMRRKISRASPFGGQRTVGP
jgi:peptidoglycan/LPS O-acetylase OafA/YrhL